MLNNKNKLFFPKIIFDTSVELIQNSGESRIINLYYLDWSHKELKCNGHQPELSSKYEDIIKNLRFAISDHYIEEIRRVSWLSISELNTLRRLDDSMRQLYLVPSASYINTAFKLLSDTIFDTSTNFYYRGFDKLIFPYLLLYKFWKNQRCISSNMILEFSQIHELLTMSMNSIIEDSNQDCINEFLSFVNKDLELN